MKTKETQTEARQHAVIAEKQVTTNTNVHTSKMIGKTSYQDWRSQKTKMVTLSNVATTMRYITVVITSILSLCDIANNALASWFRNCKKAYLVQKERGFDLDHKTKRGGANRTCGFCGGKDHTRRNCPEMEQFLKDCYKANENWRYAAYKELVLDGGLSVGACVQVEYTEGSWNNQVTKRGTGIITKDKLEYYQCILRHEQTL